MTRIFEALKKSRVPRTSVSPPPALQSLRSKVATAGLSGGGMATAAMSAVGRVETTPDTYVHELRPRPFSGLVDLPEEVVREMTAVRMTIEAAFSGRLPRTIMFMSAQRGEGSSTVAAQFAAATARDTRQRVLLMDLHARRPSPFVDAPARPQPTGVQRIDEGEGDRQIDVLPVPEISRRNGVIPAPAARDWIDAFANRYDWVVLDGPPLLEAPDAASLAAVAEGVILVIEAGRTKRPVIHRATDLLRKARANTIGSVLNRRRLEIPGFLYRRI
jgi:Mrp family chromosome partitioning ATPase